MRLFLKLNLRSQFGSMLILMTLLVLGSSCAHTGQPSATTAGQPAEPPAAAVKAKALPEPGTAVATVAPSEQIVRENNQTYRVFATPFGMVKEPIEINTAGNTALQDAGGEPETAPAGTPKQVEPHPPGTSRKDPAMVWKQPADSAVSKNDAADKGGGVTLNFDDADLGEVIRTLAEILDLNYIVDSKINGNVTIHTAGKLYQKDLFPVFHQILEANGLAAVKEGALYKIVKTQDAPRLPLITRYGRETEQLPPGERMAMQIIPLNFIQAAEMTKILTPFISADGTMVTLEKSNTIVLVDKGINILKALRLVETFDLDLFDRMQHRFYRIEYNEVSEITTLLTEMLGVYVDTAQADFKMIPIERLNMLLVVARRPQIFKKISEFLSIIDAPNETVAPRLYVYSVKNGQAADLAGLLQTIFQPKEEKAEKAVESKKPEAADASKPGANPFSKPEKKLPKTDSGYNDAMGAFGSGTLRGEISITADTVRNLLIFQAIPSDYQVIRKVLEALDVMPRQVLIEAMIAEITLGDNEKFGVEWQYVQGEDGLTSKLLSATMGSSGLTSVIGETDRWSATLSALASDNKVNILSSPSVLASNDKEARINISTEVPVASARYDYTNNGGSPLVQTNIEYRNTGIILSVKPQINSRGMVNLEISQEVSEKSGDVVVGGQSYPSFFQRSVTTSLTVGHNQTIAIGGFFRENKSEGKSGVPYLQEVPFIGSLFGNQSKSLDKNELIILITPRVIVDMEGVEAVTRDFRKKIGR